MARARRIYTGAMTSKSLAPQPEGIAPAALAEARIVGVGHGSSSPTVGVGVRAGVRDATILAQKFVQCKCPDFLIHEVT